MYESEIQLLLPVGKEAVRWVSSVQEVTTPKRRPVVPAGYPKELAIGYQITIELLLATFGIFGLPGPWQNVVVKVVPTPVTCCDPLATVTVPACAWFQ